MGHVISQLPRSADPDLLVGTNTADDAAVYRLTDDLALVQSVDFFTPVVDDPYDFGRIAAANSLSDIYAMGATPLIALNIVGFPVDTLPLEHLVEMLRGGAEIARQAGMTIVGGHTIDDREPKYGLAVTGTVRPGSQVTNATAQPGDSLILTKPLGTGIVATAIKRGTAGVAAVEEATQVMATLNRDASLAALANGVTSMTDITGFGLLGHLLEMCKGSGVSAEIWADTLPWLRDARSLAEDGVVPGGTRRNLAFVGPEVEWADDLPEYERLLLADAQTSGGLLIAVPSGRADALIADLRGRGTPAAALVGRVTSVGEKSITVRRGPPSGSS